MTTFESSIKTINAAQEVVYQKMADLSNLQQYVSQIEQNEHLKGKVKNVRFDVDSCHASIEPLGELGIRIIDREPYKTIKFEPENSPLQFNLWIQLVSKEPYVTKMKITPKADIGFMMKGLVSKPLQKFVDGLADAIERFPF